MSIFRKHRIPCPSCGTPMDYELVHSVNVDRRPDLREAILDGSFQLQECPSCGTASRCEPEFTYMDQARRQFIAVWPASKRHAWKECAEKSRATFDAMLGKGATREARAIGEKLDVRTVFGWPALVEKLLARGAGIDDRTLEAAKLAVMRTQAESPLPGTVELRMIAVEDGAPVLAWLGDHDDSRPALKVPRTLLAEIDAHPEKWQPVRQGVGEGDVVDFQREMLAS